MTHNIPFKWTLVRVVALLLLLASVAVSWLWRNTTRLATGDLRGLRPVPRLDLARYLGMWYEHRRFDNWFERGLDSVTATYTWETESSTPQLRVMNRGRQENGEWKTVRGLGVPTDQSGVLQVSFFPLLWAQYVVLYVDTDYMYALVGSPDRNTLWILSRSAEALPEMVMQAIGRIAVDNGFDVTRLRAVQHAHHDM